MATTRQPDSPSTQTMLRFFCGPAPHHSVTRSGVIRYQKSRRARPLWRLVAVDEEGMRLWGTIFRDKPNGTVIAALLRALLHGEVDGRRHRQAMVPRALALRFPEITDVLDRAPVEVTSVHSGFVARVHLVKAWDEYLQDLSWALHEIREDMVTVDEFTHQLSGPHGWLAAERCTGSKTYYDQAKQQAAIICRHRGRDPARGRHELAKMPRIGLNTHAGQTPLPDLLNEKVHELRRDNDRLTQHEGEVLLAGETLLALRNAVPEEQAYLEMSLADIVIRAMFHNIHNPYDLYWDAGPFNDLVGNDTPDALNLERAMILALDMPLKRNLVRHARRWDEPSVRRESNWMRLYWVDLVVAGESPVGPHLAVIPRHNRVCAAIERAAPGVGFCLEKVIDRGDSGGVFLGGVRHAHWDSAYSKLARLAMYGVPGDAPKKRWFADGPWTGARRASPLLVLARDPGQFESFETKWPGIAADANRIMNGAIADIAPSVSVSFGRLWSASEFLASGGPVLAKLLERGP